MKTGYISVLPPTSHPQPWPSSWSQEQMEGRGLPWGPRKYSTFPRRRPPWIDIFRLQSRRKEKLSLGVLWLISLVRGRQALRSPGPLPSIPNGTPEPGIAVTDTYNVTQNETEKWSCCTKRQGVLLRTRHSAVRGRVIPPSHTDLLVHCKVRPSPHLRLSPG